MPIQIYLCLKYLHLKPVVVKLSSISSSKLLCEASSPPAMFVTTCMGLVKTIGNVAFPLSSVIPHCYARPNSRISIFDVSPEPLYTWHSDEDGLSTRLFILPLLPEIGFVVANKTFDIVTG